MTAACASQLTATDTLAGAFTYNGTNEIDNIAAADPAAGQFLFTFLAPDGLGGALSRLCLAAYPPTDLQTHSVIHTSPVDTDAGGVVIDGAGHAFWVGGYHVFPFSRPLFLERVALPGGAATTIYSTPSSSVFPQHVYDGVSNSIFMLYTDLSTFGSYGAFGRRDLVQINATTGAATTVATNIGMGFTYNATVGRMYVSPAGDIYGSTTADFTGAGPYGLWRWDGVSITYSTGFPFSTYEMLETGTDFASLVAGLDVRVAYDMSYTPSVCDDLAGPTGPLLRDARLYAATPGHARTIYSRDDGTNGAWWIIPGTSPGGWRLGGICRYGTAVIVGLLNVQTFSPLFVSTIPRTEQSWDNDAHDYLGWTHDPARAVWTMPAGVTPTSVEATIEWTDVDDSTTGLGTRTLTINFDVGAPITITDPAAGVGVNTRQDVSGPWPVGATQVWVSVADSFGPSVCHLRGEKTGSLVVSGSVP